ncbi:MAG: hypothetical protein A3I02_05275 [Betaproteobacteria bacterium RIFCSPLOWO2_02_FULL_67_26]|nr:MAG: hypothetical protein A3I02_05275 [Betaproteobacteria bacterium RIFCSPLOWO2_02_FULL_67_26]
MYAVLKNQLFSWLFQLRGPETGAIVLVQRRVFILPTRQGLIFAAALLVMLTGSINYTLGLGFVLTFLLGALGVNAMIHTFRNLANLRVTGGRARPVFAGESAHFTVHLENGGNTDRYAIGLTPDRKTESFVDVPARTVTPATVGIKAARRGILRPGRMTLFTRFPLGLYYAWAYLELDMHCLVYPHPANPGLPLPPAAATTGAGAEHGRGQEDFSGLRQYHVGDSPRHIAWKAAARDQGLLTKQFTGRAESELWLDWTLLPQAMGVEERLSHLARWVLDAHVAGLSYGLRLPGVTVDMAMGEAQRDRCLEALALYD